MKKSSMFKRVLTLVLSLAMILSLAACGNSATSTKDTLVVEGFANCGNFTMIGESVSYDPVVVSSLFSALTMFGPEGDVKPAIAETWDISDDGCTYTFHLKQDAKFSDGSAITAEDFKYSYDNVCTSKLFGYFIQNNIKSVEVVDEHTLNVTMLAKYMSMLELTSQLFVAIPKAAREAALDTFDTAPTVSSGPYCFVSQETDGTVILKANENYWSDQKPAFENVQIRVPVDPANAAIALENDEIDLMTSIGTISQMAALSQTNGVTVNGISESWRIVGVPLMGQLSTDENLRKAIYHGINPENAIKIANEGMGTPATDLLPSRILGQYAGKVSGMVGYDEALAKEYLAKSNYNGEELTISIYQYPELATTIQSDLQQIGINVKVEMLDANAYTTKLMNGQVEMYCGPVGGAGLCTATLLQGFTSTDFQMGCHMDVSAEYDALIGSLPTITDNTELDNTIISALSLLYERASFVPLYSAVTKYAVNNAVSYDYPSSSGTNMYYLQYATPNA